MGIIDIVVQVGIAVFGFGGVFLVGLKDPRHRRFGYLAGLLGQPFWFYLAVSSGAWGIFALACLYTYSWANGLRNNWNAE